MKRGEDGRAIAFFSHSLRVGGIETLITRAADYLLGRGWRVIAIVMEGGGVLERSIVTKGASVFHLQKGPGLDVAAVRRLREILKAERIRVLHTHNYSPWVYAAVARVGLQNFT